MSESTPEGGQPNVLQGPPTPPTPPAPAAPKAAEGDRAVASNLDPTDPSEEFATSARDERVDEIASAYAEDGDNEAADRVREQLTKDPTL